MAAGTPDAVFELRPMNLADLLDAVIRLYRHNFGVLLRIAAVVHIPLGVLQITSAALAVESFNPDMPATAITPTMIAGAVGYVIYAIFLVLALPIMQGAMAKAVGQTHLGEEASVGGAYRFALRRWGSLLGATLLYALANILVVAVPLIPAGVLIGGAFLSEGGAAGLGVAAVVAGIVGALAALLASVWVTFKLIFGPLVVVLEERRAVDALRRSWDLTDGHFLRVAVTLFVVGLLTATLTYTIAIPLQFGGAALQSVSPAAGQALAGVGMVVAQLFLQPVQIVASVLLYYDLRMRKEGFDLVMMARSIDEPQLAARTPQGEARPAAALYGPPKPPPPSNGDSNEPAD